MPKQATQLPNIADFRSALKERESDIQLLQETFNLVASELNLEKIFDTVSKRVLQLVDAETVLIPTTDIKNDSYIYSGGAGVNAEEIIGESLPIDFGVCGWVWKNKKPWWRGTLNELSPEERTKWEDEAGTIILVPLIGRKSFLGGIAAMNKKDGLDFTRRDLDLLTMFAGIVSIAIENAIAVQELEHTQELLLDHQNRLQRLNKQYSESSNKIEQLSLYDTLTGLPNRVLFTDRLNNVMSIAQNEKLIVGILLIDINNFKTINDALGHESGDQLLVDFCERIKSTLNPNETFSRLGSDEFIIIHPNTSLNKTVKKAKHLLKTIDTPFLINHKELNVNARIGIVMSPQHGTNKSSLLRHADTALYLAKNENSGYHIFNAETDHQDDSKINLAIDLNEAFTKKQFELFYQPKIDIKSGSIVSAEALGRWKHPDHGYISPGIFIDALERYNLIDKYTYSAIETAIQTIENMISMGHNLKLAVNISTRTLINPEFIKKVEEIAKDFSISKRLIFEITESLFLSDQDHILESLMRIRSLGINLSIDDFGTGYSSLSRLKKLPVNELKIDQSFIFDMQDNLDDQIIVKSIIDLAHNLGLSVVAEGVERKETLDKLNALNCDIAQGYYIAKPMPLNQFELFLKNYK